MKISVLWLLAMCACTGGTEINAGSYDQSCKSEIDCVPVTQGNVCVCGCPNSAVNLAQVSRYNMDVASLKMMCGATPEIACAPCSPRRPLCTGNKCSARPE